MNHKEKQAFMLRLKQSGMSKEDALKALLLRFKVEETNEEPEEEDEDFSTDFLLDKDNV